MLLESRFGGARPDRQVLPVRNAAPGMLFESLFGGAKPPSSSSTAAREEATGDGRAQAAALGLQLPLYDVLASGADYEVRRYQRLAAVECEYEKRLEGYALLGGYCAGETEAGLPMPKTAPCVMRPTSSPKTMWYILPNPHTPLDPEDAPVPPPVRCSRHRDVFARSCGVGGGSGRPSSPQIYGVAARPSG